MNKKIAFAAILSLILQAGPAIASADTFGYGGQGGGGIVGLIGVVEGGTPPSAPQGAVLGASTYNFTKNLSRGSSGPDVIALQTILIAEGFLHIDAPNGFFGPMTEAAVKAYQTAHGIEATGIVGPLTRAVLNQGMGENSTPEGSGVPQTNNQGQNNSGVQGLLLQLQGLLVQLQGLWG